MPLPLRLLIRQLAAVAATGLLFAVAGAAEKKDTRPVLDPPPPAQPQSVTVTREGKVEIPLRIFGVQSEPLRYLIKTAPTHGKLSEPRVVSREVSSVTYEPPADLAVKADRFTFSVQSHAGVSAPVEVTISITDLPSQFAVPYNVQFGELLAGNTATREIEVANRGGGYIEGEIQVDPPFKVDGRATYRLHAGDYTYFKIIFAPSEGGQFRRELRYTSHPEFITTLVGDAQTPISVEPAKVELLSAGYSAVRTGAFEIINRTADEFTFQLKGGTRLQVPATITVAAHDRAAIPVSTKPEDVRELDDEVRVESNAFLLRVPVKAGKVGPILRLAQKNLTLGRVDAARGTQAEVELENAGGTATKVTGQIGAPFALQEASFDLQPGEKKKVTLLVKAAEAQQYRTWLKFKAGLATAEVEVEAELVGDSPQGRAARSARSAKATPEPVKPGELPAWTPDLEVAKAIRVINAYPTHADLEWPAQLHTSEHYKLERMMLTKDSTGALRNAWVEIPKVTFTRQGSTWIAGMKELTPGSQTIRVVPINADGTPGASIFRLDFLTPPPRTLPKPNLLSTLFIGLLICGGILAWRRFRQPLRAPIRGF